MQAIIAVITLLIWLIEGRLPYPEINVKWPIVYSTNYLRPSRYLTVKCLPDKTDGCPPDTILEIYDEITKSVLHSAPCDTKNSYLKPGAMQVWDVDDRWASARLRCRLRGAHDERTVSKNVETIPFLNCMPNSAECLDQANCDVDQDELKFCIITKNGTDHCSSIRDDPIKCQGEFVPSIRYCPIDMQGFCKATATNYSAMWFTSTGSCPKVTEPPLSYKGKNVFYEEVILADPSEPAMLFKCPVGSPFHKKTVQLETKHGRNWTDPDPRFTCIDELLINFTNYDPEIFNRPSAMEIEFNIYIDYKSKSSFDLKIITFGGSPVKLEVLAETYYKDKKIYLFCKSDLPWPEEHHPGFMATYWWTKKSTGEKQLAKKATKDNYFWILPHEHMTNGSDEYQCHAIYQYKTCSPYRKFELHQGVISSEKITYGTPTTASGWKMSRDLILTIFGIIAVEALSL